MQKVLTPLKFETTRAGLTINSTKTKNIAANEDIGVSSDVGAEIDIRTLMVTCDNDVSRYKLRNQFKFCNLRTQMKFALCHFFRLPSIIARCECKNGQAPKNLWHI